MNTIINLPTMLVVYVEKKMFALTVIRTFIHMVKSTKDKSCLQKQSHVVPKESNSISCENGST